eukprot:2928314-Prymnesium_polylepis.1
MALEGGTPVDVTDLWCVVTDSATMHGVHPSADISDEQWRSIIDSGGSIDEFDTEWEATEAYNLLVGSPD